MAVIKINSRKKTPKKVVEKNLALLESVTGYLLSNPHLFGGLPDKFEMVILPEDDPEISLYNLKLLDTYGSEGNPVIFVRLKSSRIANVRTMLPRLYVPYAA